MVVSSITSQRGDPGFKSKSGRELPGSRFHVLIVSAVSILQLPQSIPDSSCTYCWSFNLLRCLLFSMHFRSKWSFGRNLYFEKCVSPDYRHLVNENGNFSHARGCKDFGVPQSWWAVSRPASQGLNLQVANKPRWEIMKSGWVEWNGWKIIEQKAVVLLFYCSFCCSL